MRARSGVRRATQPLKLFRPKQLSLSLPCWPLLQLPLRSGPACEGALGLLRKAVASLRSWTSGWGMTTLVSTARVRCIKKQVSTPCLVSLRILYPYPSCIPCAPGGTTWTLHTLPLTLSLASCTLDPSSLFLCLFPGVLSLCSWHQAPCIHSLSWKPIQVSKVCPVTPRGSYWRLPRFDSALLF